MLPLGYSLGYVHNYLGMTVGLAELSLFIYLFILAVQGLSCSMWDLRCGMRDLSFLLACCILFFLEVVF